MTSERLSIGRRCVQLLATSAALFASVAAFAQSPAVHAASPATSAPVTASNAADAPVTVSPNYVIGPGDRLRVTVWNQENVSGEYAVSGDGSFTFPLIGRVMAGGLTLAGLEADDLSAGDFLF
jgi:polysaccharide export outer membrane protein